MGSLSLIFVSSSELNLSHCTRRSSLKRTRLSNFSMQTLTKISSFFKPMHDSTTIFGSLLLKSLCLQENNRGKIHSRMNRAKALSSYRISFEHFSPWRKFKEVFAQVKSAKWKNDVASSHIQNIHKFRCHLPCKFEEYTFYKHTIKACLSGWVK